MIFLAKVKDENEKISRIRIKAICYAIYLLGIYYIVMLVRGVYNGNLEEADNSIAVFIWLSMYFVWSLAFKRVR